MALFAILAALAASAPTALEAFQTFEALCITTAAQPAAAMAKADAQGWAEIPADALRRMPTMSGDPANLRGRARPVSGGGQVLIVESVPAGRGMPASNNCQLNTEGLAYSAVLPLAARWAGVSPAERLPKGTIFVFSNVAGQHKAVSLAEVEKAGAQAIRARAITQFNVHDLSRGAALQVIIPVR